MRGYQSLDRECSAWRRLPKSFFHAVAAATRAIGAGRLVVRFADIAIPATFGSVSSGSRSRALTTGTGGPSLGAGGWNPGASLPNACGDASAFQQTRGFVGLLEVAEERAAPFLENGFTAGSREGLATRDVRGACRAGIARAAKTRDQQKEGYPGCTTHGGGSYHALVRALWREVRAPPERDPWSPDVDTPGLLVVPAYYEVLGGCVGFDVLLVWRRRSRRARFVGEPRCIGRLRVHRQALR